MPGYGTAQSNGGKERERGREGEKEGKEEEEKRDNETWPVVMGSQLINHHFSLLATTKLSSFCWSEFGVGDSGRVGPRRCAAGALPQTVAAHPALSPIWSCSRGWIV